MSNEHWIFGCHDVVLIIGTLEGLYKFPFFTKSLKVPNSCLGIFVKLVR